MDVEQLTEQELDALLAVLRRHPTKCHEFSWRPTVEQVEDWIHSRGDHLVRQMVEEHMGKCDECADMVVASLELTEPWDGDEHIPPLDVRIPNTLPESGVRWHSVGGVWLSLEKTGDDSWFASCPAFFNVGIEATTQHEALQTLAEAVAEHCRELTEYKGAVAGRMAVHKATLDRLIQSEPDWINAFVEGVRGIKIEG